MIGLDENIAATFPKSFKPKEDTRNFPKVYTVVCNHFGPTRVTTCATKKGAEIAAAELTNEIRADIIEMFGLDEDEIPKATCTDYRAVLAEMFQYDHEIMRAVEIVESKLELL